METDQTTSRVLDQLTKVAWFFFCIAGANLVLGSFFYLLQYPNDKLLLQTGIFVGSVAAVALGGLHLAQTPSGDDQRSQLERLTAAVVLMCTIVGAAAAVFTYLVVVAGTTSVAGLMQQSVIAFAAGLVVTGTLKLVEGYTMNNEVP